MSRSKNLPSLFVLLSACLSFAGNSAHGADVDPKTQGIHDESEAGVVVISGNTSSQTFNFKSLNAYGWELNLLKLSGKYLSSSAGGVQSAQSWNLGLRYERELSDQYSVFAGQNVEGDIYSGIVQRYNSDVGGKYYFVKEDAFYWDAEAGYRFTVENRVSGVQVQQSYLRVYAEANRNWTKTFSTKANVEFLPNLSNSSDYQLNAEIGVNSALNDVFAIKVGYLMKYRAVPVAPATQTLDTQFTTALVAKL